MLFILFKKKIKKKDIIIYSDNLSHDTRKDKRKRLYHLIVISYLFQMSRHLNKQNLIIEINFLISNTNEEVHDQRRKNFFFHQFV